MFLYLLFDSDIFINCSVFSDVLQVASLVNCAIILVVMFLIGPLFQQTPNVSFKILQLFHCCLYFIIYDVFYYIPLSLCIYVFLYSSLLRYFLTLCLFCLCSFSFNFFLFVDRVCFLLPFPNFLYLPVFSTFLYYLSDVHFFSI